MAATAIELQPNASLNDADCDARIAPAKRALGGRLVIPDHRYQHDEVSRHADFSGDSQKLAKQAAAPHAEYILKTVTINGYDLSPVNTVKRIRSYGIYSWIDNL